MKAESIYQFVFKKKTHLKISFVKCQPLGLPQRVYQPGAEIILCMRPADDRRHSYNVTSSLIGRAYAQNDPCRYTYHIMVGECYNGRCCSVSSFISNNIRLAILKTTNKPFISHTILASCNCDCHGAHTAKNLSNPCDLKLLPWIWCTGLALDCS